MPRQFKVIYNSGINEQTVQKLTPKEKFGHFRKITASVLQDAQKTWAELWNELEGSVTHGIMVLPQAEKGNSKPSCGWPEFLEKMWQLKHYLDYAQKFCKGTD